MKQLKLFFSFKVDEGCLTGEPTDPRFGVVERDGRRIYRFRSDEDDYRIYFTVEQNSDGDNVVVVQRVLHADSLKDFFFRSGMGSDNEDRKLSKSRSFWKLIEDGEKAARK
jgi:mRNA-degrading endonuclease RelE of RelBE toxin-antitoxin system